MSDWCIGRFGARTGRIVFGVMAALLLTGGPVTAAGDHTPSLLQIQVEEGRRSEPRPIVEGMTLMPRVPVGWRLLGMTARPLDEAPVTERSLGFVLADEGPMLVVDDATGRETRLDPGEASLTQQGQWQQRASLDGEDVDYYALKLVVAEDLEAPATIGSADLFFVGDGFRAPSGNRRLKLMGDGLDEGDESRFETGASALLLVTEGELRIEADGDLATLAAGEAAIVEGEVVVAAPEEDGRYVAATIGERVADGEGAGGAGDGAIALFVNNCPPGTTLDEIQVVSCPAGSFDEYDVVLSGSALDEPRTELDSRAGDGVLWTNLPFGTYTITFTALPDGHDVFYVFGSVAGLASAHVLGDGTGFTFRLDAELAATDPSYQDNGTIALEAYFVDLDDDTARAS